MYNHHFNVMKVHFDKLKLLYTDTDSFVYGITTDELYEDLIAISHLFDTSNYPKDRFLYSPNNKKKLGLFKDETGGSPTNHLLG